MAGLLGAIQSVGGLVSAATPIIGVGAAIAGGIGSAIEAEKARRVYEQEAADNKNQFDKDYNQDYTQRSDVQATLGKMRDQFKRNTEISRNVAAVTGATPEQAVAETAAQNTALGATVQGIAGQASAFKDGVQNRYIQQKTYLAGKKAAGYEDKATSWGNFAGNGMSLASSSFKSTTV